MIRQPPRSTRTDTLFPYTTLFRSHITAQMGATANYRTGHHPRADFAENALVAIGKTPRHLVVIRRWLTIHHLHVIDPEIQQHGLFQPLVDLPLATATGAGDARPEARRVGKEGVSTV